MDLGKRQDHTAIAVVERRESYAGHQRVRFHSAAVRHVERMSLGTPYPAVVERVKAIVQSDALRGECCLTVDATGVGAAVVDMLRSARLGCELTAVTITGGNRAHQGPAGWNVPKQDLMSELQVLLEKRELRIARDLKGVRMLMRELMDVQARERSGGGVRAGAEGRGQHDDLVVALALACWKAKGVRYLNGTVRLPGM
jgi:hypothetical protein